MSDKPTTNRRSFLKWAGLGAASSVAAGTTAKAADGEELEANLQVGYSETDHVKKVYELAKF